jgi:nucleoside-diphosphate-sugar epimerase
MKGKRALITGGDGFIGAFLARRLLEAGAGVSLLLKPGRELLRLKDEESALDILRADLNRPAELRPLLTSVNPDYVFHLAADTTVERHQDFIEPLYQVNFHGTFNLMRTLLELPPERIVVAGTCEEYGNSPPPLAEDTPVAPLSPYAAAKAAATHFTLMLARTFHLPAVVVRPFLTYGPFQKPDRLIPQVILNCLEGRDIPLTPGEQTREFNFVSDIAEGFFRAATAAGLNGKVINLGCGREVRVRDVVMRMIRLTGTGARPVFGALPYRPGEAMRFYSDSGLAAKLLGWRPAVSLEAGLEETVRWYTEHRDGLPEGWCS